LEQRKGKVVSKGEGERTDFVKMDDVERQDKFSLIFKFLRVLAWQYDAVSLMPSEMFSKRASVAMKS